MKSNTPFVLILCGGRSQRLWPLSQYKSKNFIDIFGFSPLELTIKRFLKITPKENIYLVANEDECNSLRKVKSINYENIFFEPESKNTAAAILFALTRLKEYPQKTLIISPVDHFIKQERNFYSSLRTALRVALTGWICTLGITPLKPSVNFGYIETEVALTKDVFTVKRFIEKPSVAVAKKLIARGNVFYNSGMFIARILTLLEEYRIYYKHTEAFINASSKRELISLYKRIEDIPFDKAIMEKTDKIRLIKAKFFWKDFGTWNTIYEVLPKDKNGNIKKGNIFIQKGENNLIYLDDKNKKILLMGLKNIVLVDTEKYTLLANRASLDNLKSAIKELKS
jgi:mannose-1-phosphate guanylyltransferase/mannose-6-phosphate isomerase